MPVFVSPTQPGLPRFSGLTTEFHPRIPCLSRRPFKLAGLVLC
jgi:hypothetical protein